jgi:hypothetical protein
MKLRDLQLKADKANAGKNAVEKEKEGRFATAKAHAEVADRGSSRAYDKEQGSIKKNSAPRWDDRLKKWVKPGEGTWDHVGKHD